MRKLGDHKFETFTISAFNATLPSWSKICVWKKSEEEKKAFYSTLILQSFQRIAFLLQDKIYALFPSTESHTNSAVLYWQTCHRHVPARAGFFQKKKLRNAFVTSYCFLSFRKKKS